MPKFNSTELWLPVIGWESLYEVSTFGNVVSLFERNHRRNPQRKSLAKSTNQWGRLTVMLCSHPVQRRFQVHRLVMAAFIGPCPVGEEVNHIDGNPKNNRIENLEYTTPSKNQKHSYDVLKRVKKGAVGERHNKAKLNNAKVLEIRKLSKEGHRTKFLSARFKVSKSTICRVIKRTIWGHI